VIYSLESMKLVIVESPTKAKTLSSILGSAYRIKASNGHVRDLPKSGLGVDVEHNFEPEYVVSPKSKKIIAELKEELGGVDGVVLATDLDREGEAIAWHLRDILQGSKGGKKVKYERTVFHEITPQAVNEAFAHPTALNENLFDAQQARRVLDRLVGYKLSPLLWKKVRYGLSAGRVQSVAVRLVVERERERQAFAPQEHWSIDALVETKEGEKFTAAVVEKEGKKLDVKTQAAATAIKDGLQGIRGVPRTLQAALNVDEVKKSERQKNPYPPYKTSTLQQAAANVYGFSAKKTMDVAQKLFEEGHITYHRTDSFNLSGKFLDDARAFVGKTIGTDFLPEKPNFYKSTSKGAQEAHEAIRPTNVNFGPDVLAKKGGTKDEEKIYSLVWKRALESQMLPAVYDQTQVKISTANGYGLRASGSVVKFDGWFAVGKLLGFQEDEDEINALPVLQEGEALNLLEVLPQQHFTQPSARYTDATLIKALEELGIGRPSTYAPTISTITARGYVEKDGRYFVPKDVSFVVTGLLEQHFANIVDYKFTAEMEEELDEIAEGARAWVPVIRDFYEPFEENLAKKEAELKKADVTTLGQSDENCPECGKTLNIKLGKYGKFLSCSGFPACEFAKPIDGDGVDENGKPVSFGPCDVCAAGELILKQGRFGKFLACTNYPKCKNTKPYAEKIGVKCPKCTEGDVVVKTAKGRGRGKGRTFYGCSRYPDCDYASWKKPT